MYLLFWWNPLRCLAASILLSATALAAVVPRLAFEDMVANSGRIVHGRVLDSNVTSSGQFLWTNYRVQVLDSLKGSLSPEITVSEPGGTLNGVTMEISGAVRFQPGEEFVVFLYQTPIGLWRVRGVEQGRFPVASSSSGKRIRLASDGATESSLSDFLARIRRELTRQGTR